MQLERLFGIRRQHQTPGYEDGGTDGNMAHGLEGFFPFIGSGSILIRLQRAMFIDDLQRLKTGSIM